MSCVLCMESVLDVASSMQINSTKAEKLKVKHIIEQHFLWLKLDNGDNENDRSRICSSCWQALLVFHEFYERVEEAHKLLEAQDIKPLERYEFVEQESAVAFAEVKLDDAEIKLEPECTIVESGEKPKRGRGRPRRESVKTKAVNKCVKETRTPRKRVVDTDDALKIEEVQMPTIKTEVLEAAEDKDAIDTLGDVDEMDADDTLSDSISHDDKDQDNNDSDSDDAVVSKKAKSNTSKKNKPKDWLTSEERDKYIAAHFKMTCCLCNAVLKNFRILKKHFHSEHQTEGYVMCCGKKIQEKRKLVDHLRLHQDPSYFKCEQCDKVFGSRYGKEQHMKQHEFVNERKYECKECLKKFHWLAVYKRHMLTHLPDEEKKVPCPQCEKTFATSYLMNQHLKVVHLKAYGRVCDICGKSIIGHKALREHMEEHAGLPQPVIQCEMCGLKLSTKYGLKQHIKFIHTEENRKPLVCPYCSQVSLGPKALKIHVRYNHVMEPKHVCRICSKPFKRLRRMEEHMATHTGDVLYTCSNCPETFRTHTGMSVHCKKRHPKEWEEKRLQRFNKIPQKETESTEK